MTPWKDRKLMIVMLKQTGYWALLKGIAQELLQCCSVLLLCLYCSLVCLHFCYCSQLWAPQSVISKLFLVGNVQRRATRFILKRNSSNLSYRDRLIKLKLLPFNYWLEYLDLVFFFKCLHGHIDVTCSFNYYFSFVRRVKHTQG